jgi:hypothetical protein
VARLEVFASTGRGQLVVSDGSIDLKVSAERGVVDMEVDGAPVPQATSGPDKVIVRALLQALFWATPAIDVLGQRGATSGTSPEPAPDRPRVRYEKPEAPGEICRAFAEEAAKLESVRKKVPTLRVIAGPTPTTKSGKGGDAVVVKLRAALATKNGEVPLTDWARTENLDPLAVVRALSDLIDAGEARIARKQDPSAASAKVSSALSGGGLVPGLRLERAARTLAGRDDAIAGKAWLRAGWLRVGSGRYPEAVEDFVQVLSSELGKTEEIALEAREGLVASLDGQVDQARRSSQEENPALGADAKRACLELGRAYLGMGLMNRARAAFERSLDDRAAPGSLLELVNAQIAAGQLPRAIERAEALAPRLERDARTALALRFIEAGAKGTTLSRALAFAGVDGQRRTAKVLLGVAAVSLVVGAGLAFHASGLSALAATTNDVARRLAAKGPSPDLSEPFQAVANRYGRLPAGTIAAERAAHMAELVADASELGARRQALLWREAKDAVAARAALKALADSVRSKELRLATKTALANFDGWAESANAEIETLRSLSTSGDAVQSLDTALKVRHDYGPWRDKWRDIPIPLRLETNPTDVALEWNGERLAPGVSLVYLPIEDGSGDLKVIPASSSFAPLERKVKLNDGPVLKLVLDHRTKGSEPKRPAPVESPPPVTTPPKDPGSKSRIKISSDPGSPPPPSEEPAPAASRIEVQETPGSALQAALGGSEIKIAPSPGFFEFLSADVPERFKLMVEVVTSVRKNQVFFDGVKLHLTDLVRQRNLPVPYVEAGSECERPVRGTENGGRLVEPLARTHFLEVSKLRDSLTAHVRASVSDYMRREQER